MKKSMDNKKARKKNFRAFNVLEETYFTIKFCV